MIPIDHCTHKDQHTPAPTRYSDRLDWATRMRRTHQQTRCNSCGHWAIWTPKETPQRQETP